MRKVASRYSDGGILLSANGAVVVPVGSVKRNHGKDAV